jgi:hypothetical protein
MATMQQDTERIAAGQQPELPMAQRVRAEMHGILRSRFAVAVFCLLLAADLFFIFAHIYHYLNNRFQFSSFQFSSNFILFKDLGYSEWWEYVKTAVSSALLAYVYAKSRQPVYLALAVFFLWTLYDNAFELHEDAGVVLSPLLFAFAGPSAAQALGEMTYFAAAALLWSVLLLLAFRASGRQHRANGAIFIALIMLLVFFGVGIDALHALLKSHGEIFFHAFAILEDGGELVVLSAVAAAAVFTARRIAEK